jgi:hypothetical protein
VNAIWATRQLGVDERRRRALAALELVPQALQGRIVEAGADLARVAQPFRVVVADEQRPEPLAAALRLRPAADDQLLAPAALQLEPVA